jgi:hypothetical protein
MSDGLASGMARRMRIVGTISRRFTAEFAMAVAPIPRHMKG